MIFIIDIITMLFLKCNTYLLFKVIFGTGRKSCVSVKGTYCHFDLMHKLILKLTYW